MHPSDHQNNAATVSGHRASARVFLLLLLCAEAAMLAVLETMFLPLRFDGTLLPKLGDFPFPIMIVVAAVTTPLLVQWAAALSERVLSAALPLIIWFLTLMVFGYLEPGHASGSPYLLLQDWRGLLMLAGGALTGAVAVGAVMARNAANRPGLYETAGTQ